MYVVPILFWTTENYICHRFDFSKFASYNKALITKVDQMISEVDNPSITHNNHLKSLSTIQINVFKDVPRIMSLIPAEDIKKKSTGGGLIQGGVFEKVGQQKSYDHTIRQSKSHNHGWWAHPRRGLWKGQTITMTKQSHNQNHVITNNPGWWTYPGRGLWKGRTITMTNNHTITLMWSQSHNCNYRITLSHNQNSSSGGDALWWRHGCWKGWGWVDCGKRQA